jgi:hypothetical protein
VSDGENGPAPRRVAYILEPDPEFLRQNPELLYDEAGRTRRFEFAPMTTVVIPGRLVEVELDDDGNIVNATGVTQ